MKKILIGFCCFSASFAINAEIVKNKAGERIELKDNGTWIKVPYTKDDYVNDGEKYLIKIDDGNKQPVDVNVYPDVTLMGKADPILKEVINFNIKMTSLSAQYKLKNRFSYKPKNVSVTQKGRDVQIGIEYTGENSYGADVASSFKNTYYIEETGKLKQTSPMF